MDIGKTNGLGWECEILGGSFDQTLALFHQSLAYRGTLHVGQMTLLMVQNRFLQQKRRKVY